MAQTKKKVSSTPTEKTTKSTNPTTKKQPTSSEMREWYEKNKSKIERYEEANDAIKKLTDVNKNTSASTSYKLYIWIDYNLIENSDVNSAYSGRIQ